jgi:hypothetical protein
MEAHQAIKHWICNPDDIVDYYAVFKVCFTPTPAWCLWHGGTTPIPSRTRLLNAVAATIVGGLPPAKIARRQA